MKKKYGYNYGTVLNRSAVDEVQRLVQGKDLPDETQHQDAVARLVENSEKAKRGELETENATRGEGEPVPGSSGGGDSSGAGTSCSGGGYWLF